MIFPNERPAIKAPKKAEKGDLWVIVPLFGDIS